MFTSSEAIAYANITRRQLEHWTNSGWLGPAQHPGSGNRRTWTGAELAGLRAVAEDIREVDRIMANLRSGRVFADAHSAALLDQ